VKTAPEAFKVENSPKSCFSFFAEKVDLKLIYFSKSFGIKWFSDFAKK